MAKRKSYPPNHAAGRRPLDSIDSLRPSSLPPELGSLDMSWDDDSRSVGAIDLLQNADLDLDVDAGERTTAVPEIPIEKLVQATMAEADARELAESAQNAEGSPAAEHWLNSPTATSNDRPLASDAFDSRHLSVDPHVPAPTQPAPSHSISLQERTAAPPLQVDDTSVGARAWHEPAKLPFSQPDRNPRGEPTASNPRPPSRSTGGAGPNSSRPPFALEQRFSAPPTARRTDLDGLRHQMKDRYATGDFSGALQLAEVLLEADSGDLDAQRFATSCRDVLTQMLMSRIGSLEQVVAIVLTQEELRWLTLDHRAGFFLSLVDGLLTIEELLDISGMPRLESLRILSALIEQRVVRLVHG